MSGLSASVVRNFLLTAAGYFLGYLILDETAVIFEVMPGIRLWYLPAGFSLAVLLFCGARYAVVVMAATVISSLWIHSLLAGLPALLLGVIVALGYGVGAHILRYRIRIDLRLSRLQDVVWLMVIGTLVSAGVAALAVADFALFGVVPWSGYLPAVFDRWMGDVIGMMVAAPWMLVFGLPVVATLARRQKEYAGALPVIPWRSVEMWAQVAGVAVTMWLVFVDRAAAELHLFYLCFLPLIWIVVRHGLPGAVQAIVTVNAGLLVLLCLPGLQLHSQVEVQFFMLSLAASGLVLGVVISERKRAQDQIEYQAALVEYTSDAVISTDMSFVVRSWNEAAETLYGWTAEQAVGHAFRDLADIIYVGNQREEVLRQIFEKGVFSGEFTQRHRDGRLLTIWSSAAVLRDANGNPSGTVSIIRDVTQNKQAEQELRDSEERFRQLAENIHEVFWICTPDWSRMIYISPAYETIWGRPCASLYERAGAWMDDVLPEDRPMLFKALQRRFEGNFSEVEFPEYRITRADGSLRWISARAFPVVDQDGKVYRVAGIAQDITERKQVEEALRESEARWRSIIEGSPDYILTLDADMMIISTNKLATGSRLEESIGTPYYRHATDDRQSITKDILEQVLQSGKMAVYETEYEHVPGQPVFYESRVIPRVLNDSIIGLTIMVRDITERKLAEQRHLELTLEKEKTYLLRTFIGNISHDLKTPLATINTSMHLLERYDDPVKRQEKIDNIKGQAALLEGLIQNLLTISHLDYLPKLNLEPANLNTIAQDIGRQLSSAAERKALTLRYDLDESLPVVPVDMVELSRAVVNLVENAINYTPEKGAVTMRTYRERVYVVIEVCDTGVGIPKKDLPQIFERFYRADSSRSMAGGGSGLGLAIVQKVTEMHGGRVEVESVPGEGSTFRICLPMQ